MGELTRTVVQGWVIALSKSGMSASRIRQAYQALSQMMATAELDGVLLVTPCRGIRLPRVPEHEPHVLTAADVEAIG